MKQTGTAPLLTTPPAPAASFADAELIAAFEAGRVASGGFSHREHVRLAWLYLQRDELPRAIENFVAALRRFADAAGKPQLFHATITWTYLLAIHQRLRQRPPDDTFEAFAGAHPELLRREPSLLARYYREETLASDLARRVFLLPDRCSWGERVRTRR